MLYMSVLKTMYYVNVWNKICSVLFCSIFSLNDFRLYSTFLVDNRCDAVKSQVGLPSLLWKPYTYRISLKEHYSPRGDGIVPQKGIWLFCYELNKFGHNIAPHSSNDIHCLNNTECRNKGLWLKDNISTNNLSLVKLIGTRVFDRKYSVWFIARKSMYTKGKLISDLACVILKRVE